LEVPVLHGGVREWAARRASEVPLLEDGEGMGHLPCQIAGAAHALRGRARLQALDLHAEAITPQRQIAEPLLPVAAQIDAEDAAAGQGGDHAPDPVRRALGLHDPTPAPPTLGKKEHDLAAREQMDETSEDAADLGAVTTARHGNALHQVD